MRYTSPIDDEDLSRDILREEWDLIRSTMMDPLISHFRLDIILSANESEDEETYEEGIMPRSIEEASMAEAEAGSQGPRQLDETVVSRILSSSQKYTTLQPKECDSLADQMLWYNGHDVNTVSGRREWQTQLVLKLLAGVKVDKPKLVKMPRTLLATKEEKASVEQAQQQAHRDSEDQVIYSDNDYSILQRAFSGNQDRCGPPLDLCLSLLITGAIGIVLKLLGKIDATKLFEKCPDVGWTLEQIDLAEHAATKLEDLQTYGAILADGTGFGKTKQCLLAALIFSILSTENMPMLLLVPAPLLSQWVQEVRRDWGGLVPILSYEDPVLKEQMLGSRLTVHQMWNLSFPQNLRYILDKTNPDAQKVLIITSYETHIRRTSWVITKKDGDYWATRHDNHFGLVIADEAHRVKNKQTAIASILKMQQPRALIFATATPIFNSIRDLIGLIDLIGVRGLQCLSQACKDPTTKAKYDQLRAKSSKNKKRELKEMHKTSPLRLMLLDATVLNDLIRHRETLPMEADYFGFVLNLFAIQRSPGSCLPNSLGPSIAMKDMFKTITFRTADMELSTEEKIVYQAFHAKAASKEYIVETAIERTANPGQRVKSKFIAATRSLRKLAIANFSTTLAILNAKLELGDSNTHVATLNEWRQENIAAEWVYMVTKEDTDCAIHSADDLMKFLVHGSPRLRLIFQELLDRKVFEEVDKNRFGHHQKILIVDSCPLNAWYAEVVLRAALVDARTLHSALEPSERDTLVNKFNDPQSTLRVLITTYDIGSVGLNLHHACNRVILTSPGRSWAQEAQAAGRALRITSEFPLTVVRVATPNSHDQFRDSKQAEKACLQLAINRQDLAFRSIMLKELKSIQSDVNLCHESQDGKVLLQRKSVAEQQMDQGLAQYLKDRQLERSDERLARNEANTRKSPVFNYVVVRDDDDELSAPDDEENSSDAEESLDLDDTDELAFAECEEIERARDIDERWHNEKTWEKFAERTQPSDQTRYQMALLSLPYDKEWQMEELDNPKVFMIALRLVSNRIRGVKVLHLGTSMHIKYDEVSTGQLGRIGELFERDGEQQDEEFKKQIRAQIARPAR
ncbi:hypothetical protein N7491_000679 [Penicillium cf. griseofulvum]|uniref:Helicase ATP-binding domain-containing protein n=1 Tax=Penicillium cf. griseofulvum TaxID=2972120 RepID=A0A9W9IQA8_9EURO|nr:hypothetical protein N7472_011085 [Penicillium cf. griseofulvum]KAJ5451497.1 hypothetical protein N7491_000679 [Penicillium cf. griseofulvum]